MTVKELIAALEAVEDKSARVECEGCDCINPAKGVIVLAPGRTLIEVEL